MNVLLQDLAPIQPLARSDMQLECLSQAGACNCARRPLCSRISDAGKLGFYRGDYWLESRRDGGNCVYGGYG